MHHQHRQLVNTKNTQRSTHALAQSVDNDIALCLGSSHRSMAFCFDDLSSFLFGQHDLEDSDQSAKLSISNPPVLILDTPLITESENGASGGERS